MISLRHIHLQQGKFALNDINFDVPEGQHVILMGPTGSGKSTLLEVICGLKNPDSGEIFLNGGKVNHLKPAHRDIGYVPQDGALFPHMNVADNLGFALTLRKLPVRDIRVRVQHLAQQLRLSHLLERGTSALSGGERQRVALGRALIFEPSILLLDEPLSALDEISHHELCEHIMQQRSLRNLTTLHVTHNSNEAQLLGQQILTLQQGQLNSPSSAKMT